MKMLFFTLLLSLNLFSTELIAPKIVPYKRLYKKDVLRIALEETLDFMYGAKAIAQGIITEQQLYEKIEEGMGILLCDSDKFSYVLLVGDKVAGFIGFYKEREKSVELVMKLNSAKGIPAYTPEQLAVIAPQLKKTDAECKDYALIECFAISRDFRDTECGKLLLEDALEKIKKSFPSLDEVRLLEKDSNIVAQNLYKSMGFAPSIDQLPPLTMMHIIEYKKTL